MQPPTRRAAAILALLGIVLSGASCGTSSDARRAGGRLSVATAFYPLQWVTQRVGGDLVDVTSITKPGAEPHDLELTPKDVAEILDAGLVVYVKGFQAAVDDAVTQEDDRSKVLDVEDAAGLDLTYSPVDDGSNASKAVTDPHFWLDPSRLADVATKVATRLGRIDPTHTTTFATNASTVRAELGALDHEYSTGLATCRSRDLVTSHQAFGYLSRRYGLTQIGIAGMTPDAEPSASTLSSVTRFVRQHSVGTIYFETLASPAIARTIAAETGARTAQLDPIEGLTDRSKGHDYLEVMRSNLVTLRAGQGCT